jgi:biopolymer transport protein ExbB
MPKSENTALVETRARYEISKLERGLVALEIIVGIAPLTGLVGTIFGLITLFASMEAGVAADSSRFANGISIALYATLLGLLIAIPALIAWSYYSRKVESFAVRMEALCDEFLRKHYRTEGPGPNGEPAAMVARSTTPPKLH